MARLIEVSLWTLPNALWRQSEHMVDLSIQMTNVTEFPVFVFEFYERNSGLGVYAHGTPLCDIDRKPASGF